jgi:hypothetical protein
MAWTLCTSGAAIARSGLHANPDLITYGGTYSTILDSFSDEAEGLINAETGMDIINNINTYELSGAAKMAAASRIAMNIIGYDTTGYISREADTLLNINDTDFKSAIKNLTKNKTNLITP